MRASSSAILRSSASRRRASPSACARRLRSSSVSVCSTTPDDFGGGVGVGVGAGAAAAPAAPFPGAGRLPVAGVAAGAGSALAVLPGARLRTFSTTTALVRPWLKLWRTTPVSLPRGLSVSVLDEVILSFLSPVFSVVSAIPFPFLGLFGPKSFQAPQARQNCLAFGTGKQRSMYHI